MTARIHACLFRQTVLLFWILAICVICKGTAQGQTPIRKPLPEDRVPIPEYYGLYAITDKGLAEMKKGTADPALTVGADMEIIYYSKDVSAAESLELYKLPPVKSRPPQTQKKNSRNGLNDFMQQSQDNIEEMHASLEGLPRGSERIEIRGKSITGKPEMMRLIPAIFLPPGNYQIGVRATQDSWFRFSVSSRYTLSSSQNLPLVNPVPQLTSSLPYVSQSDFQTNSGNDIKVDSIKTKTAPRSAEEIQADFERAMQAESKRVNSLSDSTKRQLRSLILKAVSERDKKSWAEAAASCEKVLTIDPNNHYALCIAGSAYEQLNQLDVAEARLSKAVQLIPASWDSHLKLFFVHAKKGSKDAAVAELESAILTGYREAFELAANNEMPAAVKEVPKFKELTAKR